MEAREHAPTAGRPAAAPAAVTLRPAVAADLDPVLTLVDDVIAWLVARGRSGQWGSAPLAAHPALRADTAGRIAAGAVTVALRGGVLVGTVTLDGRHPAYLPVGLVPADALFVHTLVSARTPAARGAGRLLLDSCLARAAAAGVPLALDHWAGSPELAAFYERAGLQAVGTVVLARRDGPWTGTVRLVTPP